jgi:hypothetical protein
MALQCDRERQAMLAEIKRLKEALAALAAVNK